MQIIGAGFGRTGTMSLTAALEQLDHDPCYHMLEVFKHPSHISRWQAAADGEDINWQDFLGSYKAGLDYPISAFYKELMQAFPDAKVILTVRDPQRWYESTLQTIYQGTAVPGWLLSIIPFFRNMNRMVKSAVWDRLFDGRFEDREHAISVFNEHIAEVKRTVPKDKLLVFAVRDGWVPLCDFLGVPIPETEFPHVNDRKMTKRMYAAARIVPAVGLALGLFYLYSLLV
jgi:hypothetical protein